MKKDRIDVLRYENGLYLKVMQMIGLITTQLERCRCDYRDYPPIAPSAPAPK